MPTTRSGWLLVAGGLVLSLSSCSSDPSPTCVELEAELEALSTPTAADAWEDIRVLQTTTERAQQLEAEIAEMCP